MILVRRYNIAHNISNMYDIGYLSFDKNSFLSIVTLYFFNLKVFITIFYYIEIKEKKINFFDTAI